MHYRYAQNRNFEDYASGRVFYSLPGQTAFPVRLASEIFQRALGHWQAEGGSGPCSIYDPVCGGAYWLVVLAYLHRELIEAIFASDINIEVLTLAERNLSLITPSGLDKRIAEIEEMLSAYQKESHADALTSAKKFRTQLYINLESHICKRTVFQADATKHQSMIRELGFEQIDMVLADVPYGWRSEWQAGDMELDMNKTQVWQMLDALQGILKPGGVVAIAINKGQKVNHEKYVRLERFQVGRRRVFILQIK